MILSTSWGASGGSPPFGWQSHGKPFRPCQPAWGHLKSCGSLLAHCPYTTPLAVRPMMDEVREWWPTKHASIIRGFRSLLGRPALPLASLINNFSPNSNMGLSHFLPASFSQNVFASLRCFLPLCKTSPANPGVQANTGSISFNSKPR